MDTEILQASQNFHSSLSTTTDISQEFSPTNHQEYGSPTLKNDYKATQKPNLHKPEEDKDSVKPSKKAIFTIIREEQSSQQSTKVPLNKDFGNYNRKEKSLGELSKRLLIMFGRVDHCMISLDVVTQQLGVERRRIYDIINILESLGVVFRKGKNSYQWKGLKSIFETISKLKAESLNNQGELILTQDDDSDSDDDPQQTKSSGKREKSLGLLSTGFIKLFLSWKGKISLEQAGRKLSSEDIEENKIKTKIRRLYDIANVFSSLGLIKKTCLESKKPAYEWIGLTGLDAFIKRLNSSSDEKEIFMEPSQKNKEKISPLLPPRELEKQLPLNSQQTIKIDSSAFVPKDIPALEANKLDNLLLMLLGLYQGQLQATQKPEEDKNLSNVIRRPTPLAPPTLIKQNSGGSVGFTKNAGFVAPTIRKTVSILQRADVDENSNSEKSPLCEGVLGEKAFESNNNKRKPDQSIRTFEGTLKKMHSSIQLGGERALAAKAVFPKDKENLSVVAKSNSDKC